MEDRTLPAAGQLFIDKEKNLVQFIAIAIYKRMEGEIAVYQALSGDYKVYAMPFADFIKEMVPYTPSKEKVSSMEIGHLTEEASGSFQRPEQEEAAKIAKADYKSSNRTEASETIDPVLLAFLEADTYEEKLNVLTGSRKNLNDRILNHMAISVDCIISDGDMEDKISSLVYCLKTHARFENKRFR
ncbi:hypothetical protein [Anaerocolumna xylanovorans]|uniref:DUF1653 domain-containing protein n=1 Tax=Anaerocolumna xylanovorans DSM 12503 TaxID=1121345 RepID=A0A1M7YBQ8_9FIRM|nr:hypothetical protein [Anaerocolumna xylanovorans]SHO50021.1 hypothetical protein SAMN02745217_02537 [Anaerocolumna xylanovorans DSM 12503]